METKKSLKKLQDWLDQYLNFEKLPQKNIFWLDTMQFLCKKFSSPETFAPSFHVAGSKGKGSVATFIAAILSEPGFRTGLYTSPHIVDFAERVTMCHEFFDDDVYERACDEITGGMAAIRQDELPCGRPVTWFELVTLFAFLVFRQAKVDFSVFEVGLGGRLDATNVIVPRISVITPIELEHTEFLGDTVEKIACEKGGIIKEGVPVIISSQKNSVRGVLEKIASEKNAPAYFFDNLVTDLEFKYIKNISDCMKNHTDMKNKCAKKDTLYDNFYGKMKVSFKAPIFKRRISANIRLLGEVQAQNAALAACAVKIAVPEISEDIIEKGLENAFLPGRFEVSECVKFPKIPHLVLDGAHTVNSCAFTMNTLSQVFGGQRFALLFACAKDKDSFDIAPLFKDKFEAVFVTVPGAVKQSDLKSVEKSFSACGISFSSSEDFKAQIKKALNFSDEHGISLLVTGSFYLVSEVKKILSEF